jgi:membrane-associated phospholipid phosphatase
MAHIGNFGDSAILLAGSLFLLGLLLWLGRRADALAFLAALTVCLATALAAKLFFHACEASVLASGVDNPSGHVSFGAVFYGCVALMVGAGRPRWQRIGVYAAAVLLTLLIGASRIFVGAHTLPDVWAGGAIGAAALLVFQALRGPSPRLVVPFIAIAICVPTGAIVLFLVFGFARHWTPEPLIEAAALRLDRWVHACAPRS